MTPTADRIQTEKQRRRDTIASDRELVIAGRKQPTRIQSHADEHPWPLIYRPKTDEDRTLEEKRLRRATLACAQRVLDGKLARAELLERLDQLGLLS
jgi:hypothetical protein